MKRKVLAVLMSFLLLVSLCGCVFRSENAVAETNTIYYGYNNLNAVEQSVYNEILEDAKNMETTFSLLDVNEAELEKVYQTLVYDHPELFWLSDGYTYSLRNFSLPFVFELNYMSFTAKSLEINQELNQKITELNEKVNEIVNKANAFKTDYEKVLFVYDYIVENTVYDDETADKLDTEEALTTVYPAQTAYGCLVEGSAICSGYSEGFQLIMQEMGFVCGNAFGKDKEDGVEHQWNFLQLEDEYYFFDLTWGDPKDIENKEVDYKSYEFFGVTTKQLELTHILDETRIMPECLGEKYNYYRYNGFYADNYYYSSARDIIKKQLNGNQFSIMFSTKEECERAKAELFNKGKFFNITTKFNEIYYYTGVAGNLLIITK